MAKKKINRAQIIAAAAKKAMAMALQGLRKKTAPIAAWFASPKSRGRRAAEIAVWSAIVFLLFFGYRILYTPSNLRRIWEVLPSNFKFKYWWDCLSAALPYHSLDYSLGFIPRALSGQILTFFAGAMLTGQDAAIYLFTVHVITYGLFSVIMGTMIEKAFRTRNYLMGLFPLLIIFAPSSIWYSALHYYVTYDVLLLLFSLVAFLLIRSRNEKLQWFVPICVCLGILANPTYMPFFFPLVFALLYYEFIKSGRKRTRLSGLIVTTASSFALQIHMLWTIFNDKQVGKYSRAETIAFIERKIGYTLNALERWTISGPTLGVDSSGMSASPEYATPWSDWGDWFKPTNYLIALAIGLPILIFTLAIWRRLAEGEKGFWRKSPYFLFMIAPLTLFPLHLFFSDLDRLVWSILMTQVLLLAYVFITDGQREAFARLSGIAAGKKGWTAFVLLLLGIVIPLIVFSDWQWLSPSRYLSHLPWGDDVSTILDLLVDTQWTGTHSVYFLAQVLLLAYVLTAKKKDGRLE